MFNNIKKIFDITNTNIVLATPLILYSLITTVYLAVSANGRLINLLFALFLFVLMTAAFLAGWGLMVKESVTNSENNEPASLMKLFTMGVGEYFLSMLGSISVILIFSTVMLVISYFIGAKFIGDPGVSADALTKAMQTATALKAFVASLTQEQLIKINQWNVLILSFVALNYFLLMFYLPALFYKTKNPLLAFGVSLKDLVSRRILKNIGIYSLIFVANFVISILSALFVGHSVMHFLVTLTNFYFITLVAVGIFYYYNNNFVTSYLGQNVDEIV